MDPRTRKQLLRIRPKPGASAKDANGNKVYTGICVKDLKEGQLPLDAIEKGKPKIEAPFVSITNARQCAKTVSETGTVLLEQYVGSIMAFFRMIKYRVTEDWEEELVIAEANTDATPLSYLDVTYSTPEGADVGELSHGDGYWLGILLGICRVNKLKGINDPSGAYKLRVHAKIDTAIAKFSVGLPQSFTTRQYHEGVIGFADQIFFQRLCASFDAFMCKVQDHPLRGLRTCTITCRLRDCIIIDDMYLSTSKYKFKTTNSFNTMAFMGELMAEMNQWTSKPDTQFAEYPTSYFCYQKDFGLVQNSKYSATLNPNYHLFARVPGAIRGLNECKNARYIPGETSSGTFMNACWVAWAMEFAQGAVGAVEVGEGYEILKEPGDVEDDDSAEGRDEYDNFWEINTAITFEKINSVESVITKMKLLSKRYKLPKTLDGQIWSQIIALRNLSNKLPPFFYSAIKSMLNWGETDLRPDSIGRYTWDRLNILAGEEKNYNIPDDFDEED